jgi:hypothetical protein
VEFDLQREILYILHVAGVLVTKIGMERLATVADRAESKFASLIGCAEVTALCLVEISLTLIFVWHRSGDG